MKRYRVVHFSTVHSRTDVRIYVKELASLARSNIAGRLNLFWCVQDGLDDEIKGEVKVISSGPRLPRQRNRILVGIWRMLKTVKKLRPDLVHFHDPELLPVGLILKGLGVKVVYDVHEDVPKQLQQAVHLSTTVRSFVIWVYLCFEWLGRRVFDANIVVVPSLLERFRESSTLVVANYARLSEFDIDKDRPASCELGRFIFVGAISRERGILEIMHALDLIDDPRVSFHILGKFSSSVLEAQARATPAWSKVSFLGWQNRDVAIVELSKASVGLVLFHPAPNHVNAQPNKLFEYMAAGIPVIASDFPLWREIVEGAQCGLLVDPLKPDAIASAMQWMIDHPDQAKEMGRRGRAAVETTYNWETESEKLVDLYSRLLPSVHEGGDTK